MKIIIQAFCVAFLSLIPQQIAAQNIYDDMPHSTVDEDQFAIAVGLRIATLEMCGHDRSYLPVFQRYKAFLENHRDGYDNRNITQQVREGVALEMIGQRAKLKAMCPKIGAAPEDKLVEILDKMDLKLREAHYKARHVDSASPEYAQYVEDFGPLQPYVAPVKNLPVTTSPPPTGSVYKELAGALNSAAGEMGRIGDLKTLIEAATGKQIFTGEEVSGINPETGKTVKGRCAYVEHEQIKDAITTSMEAGPTSGMKKNRGDMLTKFFLRLGTSTIGWITCAAEKLKAN